MLRIPQIIITRCYLWRKYPTDSAGASSDFHLYFLSWFVYISVRDRSRRVESPTAFFNPLKRIMMENQFLDFSFYLSISVSCVPIKNTKQCRLINMSWIIGRKREWVVKKSQGRVSVWSMFFFLRSNTRYYTIILWSQSNKSLIAICCHRISELVA
jgi:hypothetical protein